MRTRRHRRQAIETAAARQPHQQRLGLIVAVWPVRSSGDAIGAHVLGDQAVARGPRGGLDAGLRLGPVPHERRVPEAQRCRLRRRRLALRRRTRAAAHDPRSARCAGRRRHALRRSQSANRTISAVLSLPPETASAHAHVSGRQRPKERTAASARQARSDDTLLMSWPQHYHQAAAKRVACTQQPLRWRSA